MGPNGSYYHARGNAKRRLDKYEEAIEDYKMMRTMTEQLRFTSLFAEAMVRKKWGERESDRGQLEAAIRVLDEAIEGEKGRQRHSAYFHRATIAEALGRHDKAMEDLREAREVVLRRGDSGWAPGAREVQLQRIEKALERLRGGD